MSAFREYVFFDAVKPSPGLARRKDIHCRNLIHRVYFIARWPPSTIVVLISERYSYVSRFEHAPLNKLAFSSRPPATTTATRPPTANDPFGGPPPPAPPARCICCAHRRNCSGPGADICYRCRVKKSLNKLKRVGRGSSSRTRGSGRRRICQAYA